MRPTLSIPSSYRAIQCQVGLQLTLPSLQCHLVLNPLHNLPLMFQHSEFSTLHPTILLYSQFLLANLGGCALQNQSLLGTFFRCTLNALSDLQLPLYAETSALLSGARRTGAHPIISISSGTICPRVKKRQAKSAFLLCRSAQ